MEETCLLLAASFDSAATARCSNSLYFCSEVEGWEVTVEPLAVWREKGAESMWEMHLSIEGQRQQTETERGRPLSLPGAFPSRAPRSQKGEGA